MRQKKLTADEAEGLLPDGPRVHVFELDGDEPYPQTWPRERVLKRFREVGVELSGPLARRASHGLVSVGEDGSTFFFETRREKK